jgi:hypothetical protein
MALTPPTEEALLRPREISLQAATSKDLDLLALWHVMNDHSVHEKTLAELKSGFAGAQVPTRDYRPRNCCVSASVAGRSVLQTKFKKLCRVCRGTVENIADNVWYRPRVSDAAPERVAIAISRRLAHRDASTQSARNSAQPSLPRTR